MSKLLAKGGIYLGLIMVVGLLAAGLIANSILPLSIATIQVNIRVETKTGTGINGARVELYQHSFLELPIIGIVYDTVSPYPSFTVYTINGLVTRTIAQGRYTVEIAAAGYASRSEVVDMRVSTEGDNPTRTYPFVLTPDGSIPTGFDVDFYLVSPNNKRVQAYVNCAGETLTSDGNGLARFNLEAETYSVRFYGYYIKDASIGGTTNFDFTRSVTISNADTFTVYVATASLIHETPPDPYVDPWKKIWDFLNAETIPGVPNWVLVGGGLLLFFRR